MRAITFWPHHFLLNWFLGKNSGSFFRVVAIFASSLISIWLLALIKGTLPKTFGFWLYTFFFTFAHKLCWLKTSQILTSTMSLFYFFFIFCPQVVLPLFCLGVWRPMGVDRDKALRSPSFSFAFAPGPKYSDCSLYCLCNTSTHMSITRDKVLRSPSFSIAFGFAPGPSFSLLLVQHLVQHQHQLFHHQIASIANCPQTPL